MLIIYLEIEINLIIIIVKIFRKKFEINFHNLIDIVITSLMMNLFFSEARIHYLLKYELNEITTLTVFKLAQLTKRCDLIIGLVYALVCIKALPKSKFTEIITHIMLTFKRSLSDLTGFFVVFIFFLISYSFELKVPPKAN